ncbi:MAG: hypothetical protein AAF357_08570 [Verrucomicrobiota bacterium]
MTDLRNLSRLPELKELAKPATNSFWKYDEAALGAGATEEEFAEIIHVAAALRAGAAVTYGTHLLSDPS